MLSKKEIRISEMFQFFDKHRKLPFEKKRVNITLSMENFIRLKENKTKVSRVIDRLVAKTFNH